MTAAGASVTECSRAFRLPAEAVEKVLAEAPPERPSGADVGPGPVLPGPSGLPGLTGGGEVASYTSSIPGSPTAVPYGGVFTPPSTDSLLYEILMEAAVSLPLARGIVRRARHFPPDDIARLESILSDSGLSPATRRMVLSAYREELSIPAPPPKADPPVPAREEESATARMRRTLQESLELKQLQKMLAEVDRPTESASPEIERLRAENVALKETLRNHELAEALSRQLQPLSDRLGRLEAQSAPAALTKDDVVVRSLDRSLGVIAAKAAETGELRKGLIEAGAPKALLQAAQKVLSTPEERAEMLLPPTPEQMREFARRVEAGERIVGEEATEAPGLIIPGSGRPSRVGPEATGA